jgi:transcriptional regulator with XRE-family HTH domain
MDKFMEPQRFARWAAIGRRFRVGKRSVPSLKSREIAEALGVHVETARRWWRGERKPTGRMKQRLHALQVEIWATRQGEFFEPVEPPEPEEPFPDDPPPCDPNDVRLTQGGLFASAATPASCFPTAPPPNVTNHGPTN